MQFFIRCKSGSLDEWSILEIQGALEVSDANDIEELQAGVLTITENSPNVNLTIGIN